MSWLIGIAVLAFSLVAWAFWPTWVRRCMIELKLGRDALDRRQWQEFDGRVIAARGYAEAIKADPVRVHMMAEVALLTAMGDYWRGRLEKAALHLADAKENLARSTSPAQTLRTIEAHRLAGDVAYDNGDFDGACREFRAMAETQCEGGNRAAAIFGLQRLADVLLVQGKPDEARLVIERCVGYEHEVIHRSLQEEGRDPGTTGMISMTMPDLALAMGDYEKAEKLFREKAEHWERIVTRPDNIDVTRYQFHLATAQLAQGKRDEAVETLRWACVTAERLFGVGHPRTATARKRLAEAEA